MNDLTKLLNQLWDLTSIYVRKKGSRGGFNTCYTCGEIYHWKELDAGHAIPKSKGNSIKFELDLLRPQCISCNRFGKNGYGSGMYEIFHKKIRSEIGENRFNELIYKSNLIIKFSRTELKEAIAEMKSKIKSLNVD